MKWGEYSNDVQFILHWNESNSKFNPSSPVRSKISPSTPSSPSTSSISVESSEKHKDAQKNLSFR